MGANRAGDNLRRKRKRHLKNIRTQDAAALKREQGAAKKEVAKKKPVKKAAPKAAAAKAK